LNIERAMPEAPLSKAKHRSKQPSDPNFDARSTMYRLAGTDLTQIHGIGAFLVLRSIGECGTDLSRWRTTKHFTSWLTLSSGCKISGGKVLSAHARMTSS
jgi:transposase